MIRRLSAALILILACPTVAWAATNSLHEGAWGLEFQVQAPLLSSNYSGAAGIGAIRHFSDRSAVRLGMMVGINSEDSDGTRTVDHAFPYDTTRVSGQAPGYSDSRDVSAFIHLAHYMSVGTRLGVLVEAGPSARWISNEYGSTDVYPYSPGTVTYVYASDRDSWSYGGDLQLGFQWFFRSRLSLAGRYGITGQRTESKQTQQSGFYNYSDGTHEILSSDTHSDGFTVQTTPAVISLIAYF
jgi:hypothetical protein